MDHEAIAKKQQKELNAGVASLALLGLIARQKKPMYGYDIAKSLERIYGGQLPMASGALYPVLRSLEKQGLLSSSIQPSESGPPRKYYAITADGKKALKTWEAAWRRTASLVDAVLGGNHAGNSSRSA